MKYVSVIFFCFLLSALSCTTEPSIVREFRLRVINDNYTNIRDHITSVGFTSPEEIIIDDPNVYYILGSSYLSQYGHDIWTVYFFEKAYLSESVFRRYSIMPLVDGLIKLEDYERLKNLFAGTNPSDYPELSVIFDYISENNDINPVFRKEFAPLILYLYKNNRINDNNFLLYLSRMRFDRDWYTAHLEYFRSLLQKTDLPLYIPLIINYAEANSAGVRSKFAALFPNNIDFNVLKLSKDIFIGLGLRRDYHSIMRTKLSSIEGNSRYFTGIEHLNFGDRITGTLLLKEAIEAGIPYQEELIFAYYYSVNQNNITKDIDTVIEFYNTYPQNYYAKTLMSSLIRELLAQKKNDLIKSTIQRIDISRIDHFDTIHLYYILSLVDNRDQWINKLKEFSPLSYQTLAGTAGELPFEVTGEPDLSGVQLDDEEQKIYDVFEEYKAYEVLEEFIKGGISSNLKYHLCDQLYNYFNSISSNLKAIRYATWCAELLYGEGLQGVDLVSLQRMFPLPFTDIVKEEARLYGVEPAMVYAIMRQESRFEAEIVSRAGAVGLMQIMPSTGAELAGRLRLTDYSLTDPSINIKMGTFYLNFLRRYSDDVGIILASYNAGPNKIRRWSASVTGYTNAVKYELIPYSETRNYIRMVYRNYYIYNYLLKNG